MHQNLVRRSLQALTSPVVVIAALTLGFNAWVAQRLWPSWWTGKLGDVAWLVVAPLLAALFVGLLAPPRWDASRLGAVVIALTGAAFALVKTLPSANVWAVDAIRLLGIQPKLALDPTDLLALPTLLLTEWIWLRQSASEKPRRGLLRITGAMLAAAALLADSPGPQLIGPTCIEARDGALYGYSQGKQYGYFQSPQSYWAETYLSNDGGSTWTRSIPTGDDRTREVACAHDAWPIDLEGGDGTTTQLYFVPNQGVYVSQDGGQTLTLEQPVAEVFSVLHDRSSGNVIIAAGSEGLLVRTADRQWAEITGNAQ